jgi:hypothetical protein
MILILLFALNREFHGRFVPGRELRGLFALDSVFCGR